MHGLTSTCCDPGAYLLTDRLMAYTYTAMDADVRARFEAKIDRTGTHHIWTGSRSASDTGRMRINGRLESAPRLAWTLAHGEPPTDSTVRGCADDPACVHPDHLRITEPARPTRRGPRGHGSMTSIGPNQWKLDASAGNDDRGRRRRITRTIHGTHAEATETLAELVSTAATRGHPRSRNPAPDRA